MRIARLPILLGALMAVVLIAATPAGATWQSTTKIPGTGSADSFTPTAVGLADNGAAAVMYRSGSDLEVSTRPAADGLWTTALIWQSAGDLKGLDLDMNAAGDVVVAFRLGDATGPKNGFLGVAYKPAGGVWGSTVFVDDVAGQTTRVSASINSAGTAIVGWLSSKSTPSPTDEIRTVIRTKAGSWPATNAYTIAASEPHGGGTVYALSCGGPSVAIDDSGKALATWSTTYGSFNTTVADDPGFCGVRTTTWNGSAWASPTDVTPRPAIGYGSTVDQASPTVGVPVADADPVSGKLTLSYMYNADSYDFTEEKFELTGWTNVIYGGTVAGGATGAIQSGGPWLAHEYAVGVGGNHAVVANREYEQIYGGNAGTSVAIGASGSGLSLTALSSNFETESVSAAVGGNGRPFLAYWDLLGSNSALVWTGPPSQALCAPRTILTQVTNIPSAAANASGDGIITVGNSTGLYYADYTTDSLACGASPPEPGGGGGSGGGNSFVPGPPAALPPSNAVKVQTPKSLPNGKVQIVVDFPGAGKASLKATAKDLKKKSIVAAQKTATVTKSGKVTFTFPPSSKAAKVVKKKKKLSASLAITFTPTGGTSATSKKTIVFKAPK